jgi:hypothetical protein
MIMNKKFRVFWSVAPCIHNATSKKSLKRLARRRENLKSHIFYNFIFSLATANPSEGTEALADKVWLATRSLIVS